MPKIPFTLDEKLTTEVEERNYLLSSLLKHTDDFILILDINVPKVTFANQKAVETLGHDKLYIYKSEASIFDDAIHPDDQNSYLEHLKACQHMKPESTAQIQVRLKGADSEYHWYKLKHIPYRLNDACEVSQVLCLGKIVWRNKNRADAYAEYINKLKQSGELFDAVFNASLHGTLILKSIRDQQGIIQDFEIILQNEVSKEIYGSNVIGEHYGVLFPSIKDDHIFNQLVSVVDYNRVVNTERLYIGPSYNGWFHWSALKLGDGLALCFEDITKRKQVEQELEYEQGRLEEANEIIKILLNTTKTGMGRWNWQDNRTNWDKKAVRILGFSGEEEQRFSDGWMKRIHQDDRAEVANRILECMDKGTDFLMKYKVVHDDGEVREVLGAGRMKKNYQGRPIDSIWLVTDITEWSKPQYRSLDDATHFLSKVAETIPDIVILFDLETGTIKYINQDTSTITGYPSTILEAMDKEELLYLVHDEDRKNFLSFLLNFSRIDDSAIQEVEYRLRTTSNKYRNVHFRGKVFKRNKVGHAVQVICTLEDVTEKNKAISALIESEKLSMKGSMARTITHEVRGPLNNINLTLELVQRQMNHSPQAEDINDYIGIIQRSTFRINELVNELLSEHEDVNGHFERVDLSKVVDEALVMAQDRIFLTGINVVKEYQKKCFIWAHKERLRIAILNLIVNGAEAVERCKGRITIAVFERNNKIMLSIADNGCGIAKADISKIFNSSYTNKLEGMGIGLSTVKGILKAHHADIHVNSKKDVGTTFILKFDKINN